MLFEPKHRNLITFDAPADGGEGGTSTVTDKGTVNATGDPGDPNSGKPKPITFESEDALQAEIENRLKVRLAREKEKAEAAAAKAKADAEAEAAKKNGEWQKLAEQREKELQALNDKLAGLQPASERAEKLEAVLKTQLETAKKVIPAHILPLLDKLPVDEQLAYIAQHAAEFKTTAGGPPATPPPADPSEASKAQKEQARPAYERTIKGWF